MLEKKLFKRRTFKLNLKPVVTWQGLCIWISQTLHYTRGRSFLSSTVCDTADTWCDCTPCPPASTQIAIKVEVPLMSHLGVNFSLKDPLSVLLVLLIVSAWTLGATAYAGGAVSTVPPSSRDIG